MARFVRRMAFTAVLFGAVFGGAASGCNQERDPIDRTQPNGLPKSFFVGQAYADAADDPEFSLGAAHIAQLEPVLRSMPSHLFGYGNWDHLAAYPRAACRGPVPPLPRWLYEGYPNDAGVVGLSGSLVTPSETDLYRP